MHKYTLTFLLSISVATLCTANIVETQEIKKILDHLEDEHDLVVFDLDNTLIELAHDRGNDQWFSAMLAHAQSHGVDQIAAGKHVLPLYFELQHSHNLRLVEPDTHQLIEYLKSNGKHVIALTSRSVELKGRTVEQLTQLNIVFSRLIAHNEVSLQGLDGACCAHGILFCGWHNKGAVLTRFFEQSSFQPRKIIFVDDKHKYVEAVRDHAHAKGIGFLGIRYGGCDEKVRNFVLSEEDKKWLQQQLAQAKQAMGTTH